MDFSTKTVEVEVTNRSLVKAGKHLTYIELYKADVPTHTMEAQYWADIQGISALGTWKSQTVAFPSPLLPPIRL